jgi:hypothetical protein
MPILHSKEFSEQYRSLANDELLWLALTRQDLLPEASAALEAELSTRGLNDADLEAVREQLRTPAEDEHLLSPEESPPQPTELPEDWFDEKPDEPTRSLAPYRPKGVTVCAYIFWLSALVGAVGGGLTAVKDTVAGIVGIALSGLTFVAGCGLWRLRPWARKLGVGLCWTITALVTVNIVDAAIMRLRGTAVDPIQVWSCVWIVIWNVLWAIYLSSENTRKSFAARNQGPG